MIHNLIVADLMKTDIVTLGEDDSLDVAEQTMRFAKIHHLPVVDRLGRMLGMIAQSDILRAQVSVFADLSVSEDRAIKQEILAKDVMVRDLTTVAASTTALEAARLLEGHDYSCLPVVEDDKIIGLLTDRDFLQLVIKALSQPLTSDIVASPVTEAANNSNLRA
jgi:CBS domain-containing membrane protein